VHNILKDFEKGVCLTTWTGFSGGLAVADGAGLVSCCTFAGAGVDGFDSCFAGGDGWNAGFWLVSGLSNSFNSFCNTSFAFFKSSRILWPKLWLEIAINAHPAIDRIWINLKKYL